MLGTSFRGVPIMPKLTLEFTGELYKKLNDLAARDGIDEVEVIRRVLVERFSCLQRVLNRCQSLAGAKRDRCSPV